MIYHVFANRSNIGDWLSAIGIQRLLQPHNVTELLCDGPFIEATLQQLATATPQDLILIGGGGLFMDYFVPFWEGLRSIASRVPCCIWGVGYCDLKLEQTRPPIDLLEDIVAKSQLCIVRDQLTWSLLSRCRLPSPVICPSICAVGLPNESGFGVLHVDNYTTAGADVYEAMELQTKDFAIATGRPFRKTNNRIQPGSQSALQQTLGLYAASDMVVSSALHGCIIAAAMGRNVIAVSGDRKIESFMSAVGLADWVLGQTEVSALPRYLERLDEQRADSSVLTAQRHSNADVASRIREVQDSADTAFKARPDTYQ